MKTSFLKAISAFLLLTFPITQTAWGQEYLNLGPQGPQAVKSVQAESPVTEKPATDTAQQTSQDFLNESALKPATPEAQPQAESVQEAYDYERYDFDYAVDLLRPEYAAAAIIKDLTVADLKRLGELGFETGILVLHGEIVLFSSGSEDEVGVLPAVQALTQKSSLVSHTHPNIYSEEGPSGQDINEAVDSSKEEYVITENGVYAYNNQGLLNDGQPYSYEGYLQKIQEAVKASQDKSEVTARADLHEFIAEQDRYNDEAAAAERRTFRRGGTLSYTSGLTSSNVTIFSGSPYPYLTAGSSAATGLSVSTPFLLDYSVTGASDVSGFSISFDDASTSTVETQSISALTSLVFGLRGPNTAVDLEIVDSQNVRDTWTLTNISNSAEQFYSLPVSSISNSLDKTKIKQINFIVKQTHTTSTTRTGTLQVRVKGLNTDAPLKPVITSTVPAATNQSTLTITGTKEANTSVLVNDVEVVARDTSTTWTATVNLDIEGNNSVKIKTKNTIGKTSSTVSYTVKKDTAAPSGSLKINSDAVYTASQTVTLALSATDASSGMDKMSFSTDNSSWTTPETYATTKSFSLPSGDGSKTVYVKFYDKAGNTVTYSKSIILDTVAPTGSIKVNNGAQYIAQTGVTLNLSASDAGSGLDQMSFSSDNVNWSANEAYSTSKSWTFSSGDGNKTVYVKFLDKYGRWSSSYSVSVLLDTAAPQGAVSVGSDYDYDGTGFNLNLNLSGTDSGSGVSEMRFSWDSGQTWTDWQGFAANRSVKISDRNTTKTIRYQLRDKAGNTSEFQTNFTLPYGSTDGTKFYYSAGKIIREVTPDGNEIFYNADGSTSKFRYVNGEEIRYVQDSTNKIQFVNADGSISETLTSPAPTTLDETSAVKVSLQNGIDSYYVNGQLKEFRTASGIRITDFILNDQAEIQSAYLVYPDGTTEVIRKGALVRRVGSDGSIQDFTPAGFAVREINAELVQYYSFDKHSQAEVISSRIFTSSGIFSTYDELGILHESQDNSGHHFLYSRTQNGNDYLTTLDRNASSTASAKSLVSAIYSAAGVLKKAVLENGEQIFFTEGKIDHILDADGNTIEYSYLETQDLLSGLQITRGGTQFKYDDKGFLSQITTAEGVIHRSQADTDGDGQITDEDIVQLLLETTGGDKLSDFELDADGKIMNGLIETKEGIKQTIENGILTGFETVDGKFYEMQDVNGGREAVLKEWKLRDGTRVVYGGGTVSEIVFPDGKRLNQIGFSADKQIETVTEELPDGTKKFYQKGRLVKLVTPAGAEIDYDFKGLAEKITLPDSSEEQITYNRDADGTVQQIVFTGNHTQRVFSPEGTLLNLLTDGVGAEITNGEISRLFTRFGEVENPEFDSNGIVSGNLSFIDGVQQTLENGILIKTRLASGTEIHYDNGLISSVETSDTLYQLSYAETNGVVTDIRLHVEGPEGNSDSSLVVYLLDHPDSELATIFLPRPLYDSLANRFKITSQLDTGGSLFLAQLVPDTERGNVYEFSNNYFPQWANVNLNGSQGYIGLTSELNMNAALLDINGDNLPDRVYMESSSANYWWVQLNTGSGFASPVKWTGIETSASYGLLQQNENGHLFTFSDLVDINGDGKPDRIIDPSGTSDHWKVQLNNGSGFDASVTWDGAIQILPYATPSANYALRVRDDVSGENLQELVADLVDMDGDGLADRVLRPSVPPYDHWFFQKNNGNGFDDAVLWEGIDTSFYSDTKIAGALSWYVVGNSHRYDSTKTEMWTKQNAYTALPLNQRPAQWGSYRNNLGITLSSSGVGYLLGAIREDYTTQNPTDGFYIVLNYLDMYSRQIGETSYLSDMNGDGKPDRVLVNGQGKWYVQFNNGEGFDEAALWANSVRSVGGVENSQVATSIRMTSPGQYNFRDRLMELRDVTGDGLPDRVTVNNAQPKTLNHSWWVEVNNGSGFDAAEEWPGIEGNTENETAITQEAEGFGMAGYTMINSTSKTADLKDINGDNIPDRVIFRPGESRWLVQFGTGHGFLPLQDMKVEGLEAPAQTISTSRYDYLHVSLKAAANLPATQGTIKVMLGDEEDPDSYQEWNVTNLNTSWKDFYLPLDPTKANAEKVRIKFEATGQDPGIAVYVDNMTFTSVRPPASKDWLDRMLTEENVLAEVHSERNQTLAQYLGLSQASEATAFNWDALLKAETQIKFDEQGEAQEFQTLYGSVSKIENGRVTETVMPDGSKIEFGEADAAHPQTFTQTLTKDDGSIETLNLNYGRVRTVERSGKAPLQYAYEFNSMGDEITVVYDPETQITERYQDLNSESKLISRTQANGVTTSFEYDIKGDLVSSSISYKGHVHQSFSYSTSEAGNRLVENEDGVIEEYAANGEIIAHTTPEGYRYVHTFEQAKKAVTTTQTQTVTLPDGSTLNVNVPVVTLVDDPAAENVHRVTLAGFHGSSGEDISYDGATLKEISFADGTHISYDRIETVEHLDEQTGELTRETHLKDATVFHADGTVTEFRGGKPYSVTSATGHVISLQTDGGYLINPNESALFHKIQAETLWNNLVLPKWNQFQAPSTLPVQMEYSLATTGGDSGGKLLTRQFAEGVIELYEDGRLESTISPDGERLIRYEYDSEGNPIRVELEASRRRLASSVLKLQTEIAVEREKALAAVAEREQVINQTIEGQYTTTRDRLLAILAQIEAEKNKLVTLNLKGKKAKGVVGDAMQTIHAGEDQVNQALEQLARNRADALKQLSTQVQQVSIQIENQSAAAYAQIETENAKSRKAILRQEISPVVYHWYRKILGRDPSEAEYEMIINSANYETGTFNLEGLKTSLLQSNELSLRTAQVQSIKNSVRNRLLQYLAMSASDKSSLATSLGILPSELIDLSTDEANAILDWLMNGSLHFGQSAYLALEALLSDAGISFDRVELASHLILTDILSGVITPLEQGDLVISVYALKRVATYYGLNADGYRISYEALKSAYDDACAQAGSTPCAFRLIAHINGNHFIIITKVTGAEVTYIDPGAGPESALDQRVVAKDAFMATWVSSLNLDGNSSNVNSNAGNSPQQGFGYIFTSRAPPSSLPAAEYKKLDTSEQMAVRGAFFPLLAFVALAIANAVVAAVTATIAAISAIISGLVAGIGSILGGIGSFFGGIFTGNLFGALQGLFGGILQGVGQVAGGLLSGILKFGTVFLHTFTTLQGALPSLQALTGSGFFETGLTGTAIVKSAILTGAFGLGLQGVGKLLEFAGVSPKISQTLIAGGKIAIGVGLLAAGNPVGIATSLGLITSGTSEMLSLHTSLSPTISGIIGISAAATAAFAGGGFAGFKTALPYLSMDLASTGVVGIGNTLGLDWRITSLISLPVAASIGGLVGGIGSSQGIFNSIKDSLFNSQTLGGLVSVGASIGLDAIGAPPILQSFIPGILGQLTAGSIGSTGGGGGPGQDSGLLQAGKNLLGKIGDVASRLGSSLVHGVQNVINFGTQLISDGWEATKDFFSGIFSRQTQEVMYQAGVAGPVGGGTGTLDVGFELINQTKEYDAQNNLVKVIEHYGNDAGDTAIIIGDGLGNKISIERNIAGKTFSESYENLGKNSSGLAVLGGATITDRVGDNLQARYLFNDGVFKEVDYIDINAQQTLSRIQAENSSKGLQFDEKGNLFTGVLENFFTGTAYAYEAGQLMSSSIIRKDSSGIFSISSIFDPVKQQVQAVYDMTAEGVKNLYNTQIDLYDRYLDATSAGSQALRQFLDEVLNLEGAEAKVYNSTNVSALNQGVAVVDMKLDYYKFLQTMNLQDLDNLAADLIFDVANRRWRQGVDDGVPKLVDQMRNTANKVIITPGVNSGLIVNGVGDGYTPEQINALASSFATDGKRVMISHSAGTEAQLKAILEAKRQNIPLPDKFVFFSPRVSRDQFEWYIEQAGLRPDQILVVTADGDFPHYPTDFLSNEARLSGVVSADFPNFMSIYYDYGNSNNKFNYLFLEKDLTANESNTKPLLEHGGMLSGAMEDHEYQIVENGQRKQRARLRDLYLEFMNRNQ